MALPKMIELPAALLWKLRLEKPPPYSPERLIPVPPVTVRAVPFKPVLLTKIELGVLTKPLLVKVPLLRLKNKLPVPPPTNANPPPID